MPLRSVGDVDTLIVGLVERALAGARPGQRHALLGQAARLTRLAASPVVQARLVAALRRGEAPGTLAELQGWVERQRATHRSPSRVSRVFRSVAGPAPARAADPMLTPGEVARELGVSPKTVANWCKQGLLRCEVLESGHRRIPASALDAYRASQARWRRVDGAIQAELGSAPVLDEEAVFAEIAERRRG